MPRILVTAFEPYDVWTENASWLALTEFTRELPTSVRVVTRRYPVNLAQMRERLERDLGDNFDCALHLGQAPGSTSVRLEAFALNVGGNSHDSPESFPPLVPDGPVAYRTALPLAIWARHLKQAGIPARVSYHAGTFLCNALYYLSQHWSRERGLRTQAAFIHLPLATSQTLEARQELPSLPTATAAAALRLIIDQVVAAEQAAVPL